MPEITIGNQVISYEINYRGKTRISFKAKSGKLIISAPPKTKEKHIIDLINKNHEKLIKMLSLSLPLAEIHINNICYKPRMMVGKHNLCYVDGDEVIIIATKDDLNAYRKVLYAYYKYIVEQEIKNLLPECAKDFNQINIPKIDVKDYKGSRLGVCRLKNGVYTISLSAKLAKYDYKYIRVVLYHELSHVGNMNHSQRFYHHFDDKLPNAKQLQKELKAVKYRDCI